MSWNRRAWWRGKGASTPSDGTQDDGATPDADDSSWKGWKGSKGGFWGPDPWWGYGDGWTPDPWWDAAGAGGKDGDGTNTGDGDGTGDGDSKGEAKGKGPPPWWWWGPPWWLMGKKGKKGKDDEEEEEQLHSVSLACGFEEPAQVAERMDLQGVPWGALFLS